MKEGVNPYVRVRKLFSLIKQTFILSLVVIVGSIVYVTYNEINYKAEPIAEQPIVEAVDEAEWDKIENGIHVRTGLIDAEGLMVVVSNCTSCHSAKLLTQNRMTAERWNETIKWMQETQNLWDLGGNQEIIVKYLTTNYPYTKKGRRAILTNVEWYELED